MFRAFHNKGRVVRLYMKRKDGRRDFISVFV